MFEVPLSFVFSLFCVVNPKLYTFEIGLAHVFSGLFLSWVSLLLRIPLLKIRSCLVLWRDRGLYSVWPKVFTSWTALAWCASELDEWCESVTFPRRRLQCLELFRTRSCSCFWNLVWTIWFLIWLFPYLSFLLGYYSRWFWIKVSRFFVDYSSHRGMIFPIT